MRTRNVARLGVLVAIWTLGVMMLGGYTSASDAGLSCPDWPTCYGQWFPPFPSADNGDVDPETGNPIAYSHHQIMSEWIHRLLAALLGPFLIGFALLTWRERGLAYAARYLPLAGCGLLFIQYILGGLTVLHLSEPVLVTVHLGTAALFLSLVLISTVLLFVQAQKKGNDGLHEGGPEAADPEEARPEEATSAAQTTGMAPARSNRRPDGVWRDPLLANPSGTPEALIGGGGTPTTPTPDLGPAPAPTNATSTGSPASGLRLLQDYLSMTKPRVMFLLVLTSLAAMFIATGGIPALWPTVGVILGGALATGSSGAINHFLDRDLDTHMARTADRPVAAGRISPAHALTFGVVLGILSFLVTYNLANLLAAFFVICGLFFYVFVYTMWLKRTTYLNIVIGGAAGGFPALVGWAAATDSLGLGAWLLFTLIVVWTPPHFWALALVLRDDYANAKVPMLPVVKGVPRTTREILIYSSVTVALSFAFFALDVLGRIFLIAASLLGGLLLLLAIHLHLEPTKKAARALFGYSILYLGLLYLVAFVEVLVL